MFVSIDFARFVLQQYHFPASDGLFDPADLGNAHILELGCVTTRQIGDLKFADSFYIIQCRNRSLQSPHRHPRPSLHHNRYPCPCSPPAEKYTAPTTFVFCSTFTFALADPSPTTFDICHRPRLDPPRTPSAPRLNPPRHARYPSRRRLYLPPVAHSAFTEDDQ